VDRQILLETRWEVRQQLCFIHLVAKNAHRQNLDPNTALSKAAFLVAIETTFSNHKGEEDARKSLRVMKQGHMLIEELIQCFFQFGSLFGRSL
jgi:regulator of sirC expression with transglutaminase-like and TPR domain